jgi:hypothetical protein
VDFKILGRIADVELIATGSAIRERERKRLWKICDKASWRKLKGIAKVEFSDGTITHAEIHWYEAHGLGAKEHKIQRIVE